MKMSGRNVLRGGRSRKGADLPTSLVGYLQSVARETAKMSYPVRMQGVLRKGTKKAVENYFMRRFPMADLWRHPHRIRRVFDQWHAKQTSALGEMIRRGKFIRSSKNNRKVIAAKILNTFLHQLMKYGPCRPLWPELHLPLDRVIFGRLISLKWHTKSPALVPIDPILRKPPYSITTKEYGRVQRVLLDLIRELNARPQAEYKLTSRIELNVLWARLRD